MHLFAALQRMRFNFFVTQALFGGLVIAGLCPSYQPMRIGGAHGSGQCSAFRKRSFAYGCLNGSDSHSDLERDVHALFDAAIRQQLQGPPCAGPARHSVQARRGRHPAKAKAARPNSSARIRTARCRCWKSRPTAISRNRTRSSGMSPAARRWRRKTASSAPKRCNGCSSSSTAWSRISAPPISGWR